MCRGGVGPGKERLTHDLEAAALLGRLALEVAGFAVGTALLLRNESGIAVGVVRVAIGGIQEVSKVESVGRRSRLLAVAAVAAVAAIVTVAVGVVGKQGPGNVNLVLRVGRGGRSS